MNTGSRPHSPTPSAHAQPRCGRGATTSRRTRWRCSGRSSRLSDLGAAERWFTAALGAAELSGSALRRATALHELATIDVIGLGCTDRVRHARSLAAGIGAPGRVVRAGALEELARAVALAPPDSATARSPLRGLHALLLAVEDARGAEDVATELAHTPVLDAVACHYGTLARAVLAGRSADDTSAMMHFATADAGLTGAPWLRRLGRRLVAETAITDGWGDPSTWLHDAHAFFSSSAPDVARACRSLLRHSGSPLPRYLDASRPRSPPAGSPFGRPTSSCCSHAGCPTGRSPLACACPRGRWRSTSSASWARPGPPGAPSSSP